MGWPPSDSEGGPGTASPARPEAGRRPGRNEYTTRARNTAPKTRTRISHPRRRLMEAPSRMRGRLRRAERAEFTVPALASLLGGQVLDFSQVALDRLAHGGGGAGRVRVRAARRLGNDLVDDAEVLHVAGGDLHGFRRVLLARRVLPENGGAALRGDDRIDRLLHHQDPVPDREAERPSPAALTRHGHDHRHPAGP